MSDTTTFVWQTRRARAIAVIVTMVAIVLFGAASWHNYGRLRDEQVLDMQSDADRTLIAVNDHVTRLVDYAESYLRSLRAYYIQHGNGPAFRTYVEETSPVDTQGFVGDVVIIDAEGHPVFIRSNPEPPKTELSDLPYFQALKNSTDDRLIVDWTRMGRTLKRYQFRVARGIRINGRFQGVVVITLRPEAILDLFQQFGLGDHSAISIMQTDEHRYIARLPIGDRSYFDKTFDNYELWDHLKEAPHGVYHRASPVDQLERYYTFQKAANYPIASVIGVADADIDANLRDTRSDIELEVLFFSLGAIVICALVLRIIGVEERLRRTNANLVHAQRMGKIGSVEVDLVTMRPHWSEELYQIYDRDRSLGPATLEEFLAYLHPDDRAAVTEMREQHMSGYARGPNEYRIVLRNGDVRWIHREVEVVRDASGKPVKLIAAEQDVTDQKLLDQAKDAFVSTVSHELRTPLTSIRGALALIASGATGALPDKTAKLFEIALRNSERLSRLVNDLLDLQRIGAGRMTYRATDIVLAKVVSDAIETIRPFARDRGVEITFASDCTDAMVHADTERIVQVMDNLLSNAIKFSEPGKAVAVALNRRRPGWLRITVEDHGVGIPEDFRTRIFERFSQADSSDTRKIGGSGLGLNIVHAIVTHHKGRIGFESELGKGTLFHVDLQEIEHSGALSAEDAA